MGSSPVLARPALLRGDHIRVFRGSFWHHGLYLGNDAVIHVASEQQRNKLTAVVRRATLAEFADGGSIEAVPYGMRLSADEAVARAESCIGRPGYHLTANNCEHFVTWCVTGERRSAQVEDLSSSATAAAGAALAPRVGVGVVTGAGVAPAMSAPNLMSGLKTVGLGSAAGGIAVLASAGAVVGGGSMCLLLRDRESLPDAQRSARATGRAGAVGGGALGIAAVMYSIGALGTHGYGAAGLSSGLAAVGAPLGGGMTAGVAVTVAVPLLLAVLLAGAFYLFARRDRGQPQGPAVSIA